MLFAYGPSPGRRVDEEFTEFWQHYPRHVAKLAALKAYTKARKLASAEDILAGVERYKRIKPSYADYAFPASWLNAGRWLDEEDAPVQPTFAKCDHVPACYNVWVCQVKRAKERGEV